MIGLRSLAEALLRYTRAPSLHAPPPAPTVPHLLFRPVCPRQRASHTLAGRFTSAAAWGCVQVLQSFMSLQLPFGDFVQFCPRLMARDYTISSSSNLHPSTVHITLRVVDEPLDDGRRFKGVCTNFLYGLRPEDRLVGWLHWLAATQHSARSSVRELSCAALLVCLSRTCCCTWLTEPPPSPAPGRL